MSGLANSSLHSATRRFSPPDSEATSASPGGQRSASMACSTCASRSHRPCASISSCSLRHLIGGVVGIVHGELVVAVELGLLLGHAFHDVAGHVFGLVEHRLLRQIADADAVGRPGFAHELGLLPGHDAQQGRLAGAVDAHHADLGAGQEGERHVLQDLFAARIGLGQLVHDIDVLGRGHQRSRGSSDVGRGKTRASSQSARRDSIAIAETVRAGAPSAWRPAHRAGFPSIGSISDSARANEVGVKLGDRQHAAPIIGDQEGAVVLLLVGEAVRGGRHAHHRQSGRHRLGNHGARILGADNDIRRGRRHAAACPGPAMR